MPNWTDEQIRAIEAYSHPTIVSAAAGSGKTAVLVERTIRLLADKEKAIPADSVLAVTFTNDAASQMREKLSSAFEKLLADNPDDEWLIKQHSLVRLAEISTINAYCYGVVKDNLEKTPFSSGIRIMEETEANMLTDRALNDVLEEYYASSPERIEWLIDSFCVENDKNLRLIIKELYDFLRTLPYRKTWISNQLKALRDGSKIKELTADFKAMCIMETESCRVLVNKLRDICESLEYHGNDSAVMLRGCDLTESLCDMIERAEWDECVLALREVKYPSRSGRQTKEEKANSSEIENALYESAKKLYDSLKISAASFKKYFTYPMEVISKDALLVADLFEALCEVCDKLDSALMEQKIARNAVDFADTELLTVELLTDIDENGTITRTPLCEEIVRSRRYRLIIIDEFQDVNNLQNVIFKAVSDTENLDIIGSNVFVVGDAKQAIYRFRRSNPMIFTNTRLDAKRDDNDVCEALLTKNFRSRRSVLDFCNYIFGCLMSKGVGEIDYNEDERLNLGASYEGDDPATEIIFLDDSDTDDEEESVYPGEFKAVALRIRQMIDEGVLVREDEKTYRPCRAGDFCVLTRDNITDRSLIESFDGVGLKVLASDQSGYLGSREISLLLNILSCITTPMKDIPMASVMLSPILGFTDDELATVKLVDKYSHLYKSILRIAAEDIEASYELREKCVYAVTLFKKLRVYSAGMSLTALIKKVYDETDIISVASAYEDSSRRLANLQLLLEYAQSYEDSSPDGVSGFLRYIDHISKSGGDFKQAFTVTESDDAVIVKTIHKSKGLEFPFVFICQTGKRFNTDDLKGSLFLNNDCGVGINFNDRSILARHTTVFSDYICRKNEAELISEQLRLLYVALTRAKEKLFLVLNKNEKTLKKPAELAMSVESYRLPEVITGKATHFSDWLYLALLQHPEVRKQLEGRINPDLYSNPNINYPAVTCNTLLDRTEEYSREQSSAVAPDPQMSRRLKEAFGFEYDMRLAENEAKLSVTELVKEEDLDFFANMPQIGDEFSRFTAAQRGTITHRFMQLCDFKLAAESVEEEISRLLKQGHFTDREAEVIHRKSVGGFFNSEIYRRMSVSGSIIREKQFIVRFDDIDISPELAIMYKGTDGMLQGIADCIFEEADGYVLVDYKTDRVNSPQELLDKYGPQLALYKAAFDVILDKPVKSAYIYSFKLADGIEVRL